MNTLKTALVCDWLERFGGAEQIVYEILELIDGPTELWTTFDNREVKNPKSQSPSVFSLLSKNKTLAAISSPWTWKHGRFNPSQYDRVISSHHFMAHQSATQKVPHYSYVHSPARYIWRPKDDSRLGNPILAPIRGLMKHIDKEASRSVYAYACNSMFTRNQIQHFWERDATVIYPFVQDIFFDPKKTPSDGTNQDYILFVGRSSKIQAISKSLQIANLSRVKLILALGGHINTQTQSILAHYKNLGCRFEIKNDSSLTELISLYQGAIALVHPNIEDFGMSVVEAIASGTPVIAPDRGGSLEIILHNQNGFLVDINDLHGWIDAIDRASTMTRSVIPQTVQHFNRERFRIQFRSWLSSV